MKLTWAYLLIFIVSITSLSGGKRIFLKIATESVSSLEALPVFELNDIKSPKEIISEINQDFSEFFKIVSLLPKHHRSRITFFHYLSLFNLITDKDYFLII